MAKFNIVLSIINVIGIILNLLISLTSVLNVKKGNEISEKQLKESQKPDVALNVQLSSISRSIQHLDSTLKQCLSDKTDN